MAPTAGKKGPEHSFLGLSVSRSEVWCDPGATCWEEAQVAGRSHVWMLREKPRPPPKAISTSSQPRHKSHARRSQLPVLGTPSGILASPSETSDAVEQGPAILCGAYFNCCLAAAISVLTRFCCLPPAVGGLYTAGAYS